jgi:YbbR domain-containing protein
MSSLNTRKLLDRITKNWIAKAVSIALAAFLFVFHRMTNLQTRFFSAPLAVEANAAFVPASSYTRIVKVSLRGDANGIYPIQEDDIEAYIDLKKYKEEGWYNIPVQVRRKGSALGVEPLEITVEPMEISLRLDRKASKNIPLTANLQGNVESGYDLVSHSLSPTQVVLDGPLNVLESISQLYTDIIDLDGRYEDFSVAVNILNRDPLVVIRGNGVTEFRGFIRHSIPVRNIDRIPVLMRNLRPLYEVKAEFSGSVRLEGDVDELDKFTPPDDFLSVDCSAINASGEYTLPVEIELPPELNLVRREPMDITVTVTFKGGQ